MNYFSLIWNLYQQKQNTRKTKQQIESLQKRKLLKMLRYAYEHSPYYRKAFEAAGITADNIEKTPLHRLEDIKFSIRFVSQITPDTSTGKKLLIAR